MESKKINQLATELTPALSDLTIIGDPTTGISKKITLSQMASLFTGTVEEYANVAAFPLVGVADTIYIALDTNVLYRWNTGTSAYVELSPNIINSLVFSDANGFDGNISLVGSVATLTITTALTTGSVPFIGASGALSQDNANLFFDDTNNRLGINTNAPTTSLDVFGSGIIGRLNGTSTNNAYLGFASAGTNRWSIGNVQADHRFRIYNEATTSELVSVLSTGEFGIGIANPTTKVHIDGGASALIANLDANVSVAKSVSFRSDNSNRFNIEVSGTESGSNAGADFFIRRYSDAGSLLSTPITITRSTGQITITSTLNIGSATSIDGSDGRIITDKFRLYTSVPSTNYHDFVSAATSNRSIVVPNASGTLALTTDLASYLPLSGGTLTGTLNGTFANFAGNLLLTNVNPAISFNTTTTVTTTMLQIIGAQFIASPPYATNRFIALNSSHLGFETGGAERMRVESDGNILMGTTTNTGNARLHLATPGSCTQYFDARAYGGANALNIQLKMNPVNGNFFIQNADTGTGVYLSNGGTSWTGVSDERLKTDLIQIENAVEKVLQLRTLTGRFKTDEIGKSRSFFIAQDMQNVFPEAVNYDEENDVLGIQYTDTIPLMAAAIKELKAEIELLKNK